MQLSSENFSPEEISAFKLTSSVYEWFGVEHNQIPLVVSRLPKDINIEIDEIAL